jgi:N-methylhydantoinase A
MEERAKAELAEEGLSPEDTALARWIDVRYHGQSYELSLPLQALDPESIESAFHAAHEKRFGYAGVEGTPCEIVNLRVRATGRVEKPQLPYAQPKELPAPSTIGVVQVMHGGESLETPVYDREELEPGQALEGPALLIQEDTTTWLAPGWSARVDGWYNVLARRSGPQASR